MVIPATTLKKTGLFLGLLAIILAGLTFADDYEEPGIFNAFSVILIAFLLFSIDYHFAIFSKWASQHPNFKKRGVHVLFTVIFSFLILFLLSSQGKNEVGRETGLILLGMSILIYLATLSIQHWNLIQRLKAERLTAELNHLKNQVNPHFFFNTLNNLYGLALDQAPQTPNVILQLSQIMQYSIYKGQLEQVSLKDEMAYIEQYTELQRLRYRSTLPIIFEKQLDRTDYSIAPLIFTVLIENAFKHGIESEPEKPFIEMNLKVQAGQLEFNIKNSYEPLPNTRSAGGLGIVNLKKRLALTYPNRHQLIIHNQYPHFSVTLNILL